MCGTGGDGEALLLRPRPQSFPGRETVPRDARLQNPEMEPRDKAQKAPPLSCYLHLLTTTREPVPPPNTICIPVMPTGWLYPFSYGSVCFTHVAPNTDTLTPTQAESKSDLRFERCMRPRLSGQHVCHMRPRPQREMTQSLTENAAPAPSQSLSTEQSEPPSAAVARPGSGREEATPTSTPPHI